MSRKRLAAVALLVLAALSVAGIAAAGRLRAQGTNQVQATFAAQTVSDTQTRTCTGADGTYSATEATYTGTATSSDARLNGALTIHAHSVVNTASGLGWIHGQFRIDGSTGGARGELDGTIAGGSVTGSLVGETGQPYGRLFASIGATFDQTNGFSAGGLGTGSLSPAAVVFTRGACSNAPGGRATWVSGLDFQGSSSVKARGLFTLDVTRDSSGAVTGATAIFYVNYRSGGSLTLSGLTLKDSGGTVAIDSGLAPLTDSDGSGNVTEVVNNVSGSVAQAILTDPHGYSVELATSGGTLDAQLHGFDRHLPRH